VFSKAEVEEGIKSCKNFVRMFREELVIDEGQYRDLVGKRNCPPKMHSLESHVPLFARQWQSVGQSS